jgi:ATP-dependent protease ClpP protease subunit
MANWNEILEELKHEKNKTESPEDKIRRKYLKKLSDLTGRNVIIYYSGWLQKDGQGLTGNNLGINDSDKEGFMAVINRLDRKKGLDLVIHTPGGEIAATESLVDYLKKMFDNDIRIIVPQLAMSAGTMISCCSKEILMGKHSNLGPIDPQIGGIPAHGVLQEFKQASKEIKKDASKIPIWQPIIAKYPPTFVGECNKAMQWSKIIVTKWLEENMFLKDSNRKNKAKKVVNYLGNHALTKSHSRHIPVEKCEELGLNITRFENDQNLQDAILSLHHACIHTLTSTGAFKIIENQEGIAFIQMISAVIIPQR